MQADLENLLASCTVKPMVNQVLAHISNTPTGLIRFCEENGILVEAYSPVAHGELFKNEKVAAMAEKYGVSIPQLAIRYCLQLGLLPLPKTAKPDHMRNNAEVDFEIGAEDLETLKGMEKIQDYGEASMFPVMGERCCGSTHSRQHLQENGQADPAKGHDDGPEDRVLTQGSKGPHPEVSDLIDELGSLASQGIFPLAKIQEMPVAQPTQGPHAGPLGFPAHDHGTHDREGRIETQDKDEGQGPGPAIEEAVPGNNHQEQDDEGIDDEASHGPGSCAR